VFLVHQSRQAINANLSDDNHAAAIAAIAPVRSTARHILFAPETRAAVASLARLNINGNAIDEHGKENRNEAYGLSSHWHDVDTPAFAVEFHLAIDYCKERIVFTLAYARAGVKLVADLTNQDVAGDDFLSAKFFDATMLSIRVATISARALSFFMSHCLAGG